MEQNKLKCLQKVEYFVQTKSLLFQTSKNYEKNRLKKYNPWANFTTQNLTGNTIKSSYYLLTPNYELDAELLKSDCFQNKEPLTFDVTVSFKQS